MGQAGRNHRILASFGATMLVLASWAPGAAGGTGRGGTAPADRSTSARRVGPERPVTEAVEAAAPESQGEPAIAFDGTNYLVVWRDHRENEDFDTADIWGARITPTGELLDPVGFPIANDLVMEDEPEVAFGDGTFLVVWHDPHDDAADVNGARVSPDGDVLDPDPIGISVSPGYSRSPSIAFGAGTFLVTWTQLGPGTIGHDVHGARVDPDGTVLDPEPFVVAARPGDEEEPVTSYGGGSFLVAWADRLGSEGDVHGARVDPEGRVLAPGTFPIFRSAEGEREVAVAFNGRHHLVVFEHGPERQAKILGVRVGPDGSVLDPAGIVVSTTAATTRDSPAVAAVGSQFLVVWMDNWLLEPQDVAAARIDASGRNLDPTGLVLAPGAVDPRYSSGPLALAANGSFEPAIFLVWEDHRLGRSNLFGGQVGPAGTLVREPALLTRAANDEIKPAVSFDGTDHLVAWLDSRLGERAVFASVVDAAGGPPPPPILVGTGARYETPAVSFDGRHHLVVWNGTDGVTATRVSPAGAVVGEPVRLPVTGFPGSVAVAFNGTDHLVVWDDDFGPGDTIRAARVSPDGVLVDPVPITVTTGGSSVAVASDGDGFLVTWSVFGQVLAARVGGDGVPQGRPFVVSDEAFSPGSVAWSRGRYLVVWSGRLPDGRFEVSGARVTGDGTIEDPDGFVISTIPAEDQLPPRPAVSGNGPFLVAWRQRGAGRQNDVHGAYVTELGEVRDDPAFVIGDAPTDEHDVALARGRADASMVIYSRFRPEAPIGANQVYVRTVSPK